MKKTLLALVLDIAYLTGNTSINSFSNTLRLTIAYNISNK
jgi:hypothetical protein